MGANTSKGTGVQNGARETCGGQAITCPLGLVANLRY